jgi:hypothetical protein
MLRRHNGLARIFMVSAPDVWARLSEGLGLARLEDEFDTVARWVSKEHLPPSC